MRFKLLSVICAAALMTSACGAASSGGAMAKDQPGNGKWHNSGIAGSVSESEEIRLQDDFAAAVNKDFIVNAKAGDGTITEVTLSVLDKKKKLMDSLPDEKDANELKKFVDLATDWEARDKAGAEPLRKYLEAIEAISSLEDLTAYECDREHNPLGLGLIMPQNSGQSSVNPELSILTIDGPSYSLGSDGEYLHLTSGGLEKQHYVNGITEAVLTKLGYEKSRINAIQKANYRFEKKLAEKDVLLAKVSVEGQQRSRAETIEAAGDYPLEKILDAWNVPEEGVCFYNKSKMDGIISLCSEQNLEDIKSMLIVHTVLKGARYLDRETEELNSELQKSRLSEEPEDTVPEEVKDDVLLFMDYVAGSACGPILQKYYLDAYQSTDAKEDLAALTKRIIEEFHKVFSEEDWLSDNGKELCIEKLDAIKLHVIEPDFDMLNFDGLNIVPKEEGGTFLDAYFHSENVLKEQSISLCGEPYDRGKWNPLTDTTTINAYYMPSENSIYILAGFATDPMYNPGMSLEEKLGGMGTVIGHEITHGFDQGGSRYDKNGLENNWLPMQDQMKFLDRCSKVAAYYSTIRPFPGSTAYNGQNVVTEATADMGGLKVTLSIASATEGFDYDAYFRKYADLWRSVASEEDELSRFRTDVHPLPYLRVNVGVQQFEEFYTTYGVEESDAMYLAPGSRISVW